MKLSYRNNQNSKAISAFWGKPIDGKIPYQINAQSGDSTEVFIFDILGYPFNDINAMVRDIASIKSDNITMRLNTPGGDIIDTFALYQAFKNHPAKITVKVEALAASAGSVLMMAGDDIQAYSSSLIMIHNAWTFAAGNQYDFGEIADLLGKIDNNILEAYRARTKTGKHDLVDMMKAETWMTAKEAKEKGFIDTIIETGTSAKTSFDLSMFANVPDEFKVKAQNQESIDPTNIREIEKVLREAGLSKEKAKAVLARGWKAVGNIDIDSGDVEAAQKLMNRFKGI